MPSPGICREPYTESDQVLIKWQRRRYQDCPGIQVMLRLLLAHFASSLLTIEICIGRGPCQPQQAAVLAFTNPNCSPSTLDVIVAEKK